MTPRYTEIKPIFQTWILDASVLYETCTGFIVIINTPFFCIFRICFRSRTHYAGEIVDIKKQDERASKNEARVPHVPQSYSRASPNRGVSVHARPQSREVRCRACALTMRPQRRRISIVGHFRAPIVAWFPAVIYFVPKHDSGICGAFERASTGLSQCYS